MDKYGENFEHIFSITPEKFEECKKMQKWARISTIGALICMTLALLASTL